MRSIPLSRRRVLAAAGLALPLAAQANRPRVGEVTSIRGSAFVRFGADALRPLAVLDPLRLDDLITTGLASRLGCRLEGGLDLNLGERASLRLDRHVVAGRDPGTILRIAEGSFLLDVPDGRGIPTAVLSPWATINLRGTRVASGPFGDGFGVFAARGTVEVIAGSRQVVLSEGEGIDIAAIGEAPGAVLRWAAERIEGFLSLFQ